jgi:hypothetical protein
MAILIAIHNCLKQQTYEEMFMKARSLLTLRIEFQLFFRLTRWKRVLLPKIRAKIFIFLPSTSVLRRIGSCALSPVVVVMKQSANNLFSSGATLTLAHGRRYGLIGRNG